MGGGLDKPINPDDIDITKLANLAEYSIEYDFSGNYYTLFDTATNTGENYFQLEATPNKKAFTGFEIRSTNLSNNDNYLTTSSTVYTQDEDTIFDTINNLTLVIEDPTTTKFSLYAKVSDIYKKSYILSWLITVNITVPGLTLDVGITQSEYVKVSSGSSPFTAIIYFNCSYTGMSGLGTQYIIDRENQKLLGSISYTPNISPTTPTNEALLSVDNEYIDYSKSSDARICYVISGTVNSGYSIYSYNINIGGFSIYDKFKNGATIQKVNLTFQIVNQ